MTTLLLIHGGLWEEGMDPGRFWHEPGIVAELTRHDLTVLAPGRLPQSPDWPADARHIASAMPKSPVIAVAGSNGCSVAARLALDFPATVTGMVLAWPATAGDAVIDIRERARLAALGASPEGIDALLTGRTLRGVTDAELASLDMPVGVLPSDPPNVFHQRHTANALLRLLPQAVELPGCPEPPRPEFPPHLNSFVNTVAAFASRHSSASTRSESCGI